MIPEFSAVVPVLAYHQIERMHDHIPDKPGLMVDEARFRSQLLVLRALGYHSIGLHDLSEALQARSKLPPHPIVFTFDDGYAGVFESAFPLLRRHGFTATLFLIAEDFVENAQSRIRRAFPVLTRGQVSEMLTAGFEIGSHSLSHPRLTEIAETRAREELSRSKEVLENAFGKTVNSFCYPYGLYDAMLALDVAEAKYTCGATTRFGRHHQSRERFELKRIPVGWDQGFAQFVYRLLWAREDPPRL